MFDNVALRIRQSHEKDVTLVRPLPGSLYVHMDRRERLADQSYGDDGIYLCGD